MHPPLCQGLALSSISRHHLVKNKQVSSHNLLQTQHWKLMYPYSSLPRSGTVLHL
jgi:hypothetical protein